MTDRIAGFRGEHRFLSNFWPSPVEVGGREYPTVEHAYQAAKTRDPEAMEAIRLCATPGEAKRMGRGVPMRPDWERVKLPVMIGLLRAKFLHPELRERLLATGDAVLVESNTWHDSYWGSCVCGACPAGWNHLGLALTEIRSELRAIKDIAEAAEAPDWAHAAPQA